MLERLRFLFSGQPVEPAARPPLDLTKLDGSYEQRTDARYWADTFVAYTQAHPNIAVDVEEMIPWFMGAIAHGREMHAKETASIARLLANAEATIRELQR